MTQTEKFWMRRSVFKNFRKLDKQMTYRNVRFFSYLSVYNLRCTVTVTKCLKVSLYYKKILSKNFIYRI